MADKLADILAQHNLSVEDLEKAAHVRIFEKVAAQANIDLAKCSEADLNTLWAEFQNDVLPEILNPTEPTVDQKIASLTEDQLHELFCKQAAAEGVTEDDLAGATDAQLKEAFAGFVQTTLPLMAENGFEPLAPEKLAAIDEASAKLAEADALGRTMARAWVDEVQKIAGAQGALPFAGETARKLHVGPVVDRLKSLGAAAAHIVNAHPVAAAGTAGTVGTLGLIGTGLTARHLLKGKPADNQRKVASVTLSSEDVEYLAKVAASGDLAALQKAAADISKAAESPPAKDDKDKDAKKDEEEKEKAASAVLDALVQDRAVDLANQWLADNGHTQR